MGKLNIYGSVGNKLNMMLSNLECSSFVTSSTIISEMFPLTFMSL